MIKNVIRKLYKRFWPDLNTPSLYNLNLHLYIRSDGSFDYNTYKRIQEEGNKRKIKNVWVIEGNIDFLSTYIRNSIKTVNYGICHGTRRGVEQKWFREYLGCEVVGTEISETAIQFENTIQWDFHNVKDEWIDKVDFIYSNSFDHSYDPEYCLNQWMSCIRTGGICILEHSDRHSSSSSTELDPFGADIVIMPYLIAKWAKGKFYVREILEAPFKRDDTKFVNFIVIQKS